MSADIKIRTAIIGASGYSGEELLKLLSRHPNCNITAITSRKYSGKPVEEVFPRFNRQGLKFASSDINNIVNNSDVVFLALPHGLATEFAIPLLKAGLRVIDISADFRLKNTDKYLEYYNVPHPAPELLTESVYGLAEIYRDRIKETKLIACPGCYPTSILLPLIPLLKEKLISAEDIIASSASGVTGAGRKVDLPFIYPEANESFRTYSAIGHRHLPEIEQELQFAAGKADIRINFIPHLAPMNRGINSTIVLNRTDESVSSDHILCAYKKFYENEPFIRILNYGKYSDTKNITNTNQCEIGFVIDDHTGKLIITSAIDNLTKGAAGQAVQAMNIMYGFDERSGLL